MPNDVFRAADKALTERVLYIPLPRSSERCFLAFPFPKKVFSSKNPRGWRLRADRANIDEVADAIGIALNADQLQCIRLDMMRSDDAFFDDIVMRILEADAVVAVLNEPGAPYANPNVMYEVGLAHALAKPVVIVVDKPDSLPGNLVAKYSIPYVTDGTFQKQHFMDLIRHNVRNAIQRSKAPRHPLWAQASIRISRLSTTHLLKNCLDFGRPLYDTFQRIFVWVSPLSQSSLEMSINVEGAFETFKEYYHTYVGYYNSDATAIINTNFSKQRKSTQDDIKALSGHIPPLPEDIYDRLYKCHTIVCDAIDKFVEYHEKTDEMARRVIVSAQSQSLAPDCRQEVQLYATVKQLIGQCDSILDHTVSFIKEIAFALCAISEDVRHV